MGRIIKRDRHGRLNTLRNTLKIINDFIRPYFHPPPPPDEQYYHIDQHLKSTSSSTDSKPKSISTGQFNQIKRGTLCLKSSED